MVIIVIVLSAFLIPKSFDQGINHFTGEKKEKVEELVSNIRTIHFNGLQKAMMMNYKVQSVTFDNENQCYQANVIFYTFFNISYANVKANCKGIVSLD